MARDGGVEPRWTHSAQVFFRNRAAVFVFRVVYGAAPGGAPHIAEPTPLFAVAYQVLGMESTWDAPPDGDAVCQLN